MRVVAKLLAGILGLLVIAGLILHERVLDLYEQATPMEYQLSDSSVPLPSSQLPENTVWQPLFNGDKLDGWVPKFAGLPAGENYRNTFRAEDGLLSVDYSEWPDFDGEFGHLVTSASFSRYILRFEYRFIGKQVTDDSSMAWAQRNNGVMLHSQSAESMALGQKFPVSIEAQLLGGLDDGARPTANLCTPATNVVLADKVYRAHCTESVSDTFHGDQWVKAEFEVLGSDRIRHFINGKLVFEYEQPQYDPFSGDSEYLGLTSGLIANGHIAFQAESHPTQFRNIELMVLD
ncbi:MAG: DUF1080 domain-containing protein [Pseudomonadales bacterium]